MTTNTKTPSAAESTRLSPPHLRPARFEDYPEIQQLESLYLQDALSADNWRRLFLDNPLWPRLGSSWPIGWVLENGAGQVVGSLTNFPARYQFRDRELICANGRSWAVVPEYRGFALWLMDQYFSQPGADLFINTTVNAMGIGAANTFSTRIPVGDWETFAYWVTGYRGFARKALEKLGMPFAGALAFPSAAALWLKDALFAKKLPAASTSVTIEAAADFDARFDLFWEELVRQSPDKLLGVRNRQALSWHFAILMRRGRLWIYTASRNGFLRAYCILKRQDWRQGVRRMGLIDYQTLEKDTDLLSCLLQAALRRCAAEDFYLLEHLGCGLPKMYSFDHYAPYRRKLPNWPFYYHAVDPVLAAELRRPEAWEPSTYDGDASID